VEGLFCAAKLPHFCTAIPLWRMFMEMQLTLFRHIRMTVVSLISFVDVGVAVTMRMGMGMHQLAMPEKGQEPVFQVCTIPDKS